MVGAEDCADYPAKGFMAGLEYLNVQISDLFVVVSEQAQSVDFILLLLWDHVAE